MSEDAKTETKQTPVAKTPPVSPAHAPAPEKAKVEAWANYALTSNVAGVGGAGEVVQLQPSHFAVKGGYARPV